MRQNGGLVPAEAVWHGSRSVAGLCEVDGTGRKPLPGRGILSLGWSVAVAFPFSHAAEPDVSISLSVALAGPCFNVQCHLIFWYLSCTALSC